MNVSETCTIPLYILHEKKHICYPDLTMYKLHHYQNILFYIT